MKPEMTTLIQYRLNRARESIEEAKLLLENGGTAPDYYIDSALRRI